MINCRYCSNDTKSNYVCNPCQDDMIYQTDAINTYGLDKQELNGLFNISFKNPHKKSMLCHKYNADDLYKVLVNLIAFLPDGKRKNHLIAKKNAIDGINYINDLEDILNNMTNDPEKNKRKMLLCKSMLLICKTASEYRFITSTKIFNNFVDKGDINNLQLIKTVTNKLTIELEKYIEVNDRIKKINFNVLNGLYSYYIKYVKNVIGYVAITKKINEAIENNNRIEKEKEEKKLMLESRKDMMMSVLSKQFDKETYTYAINCDKFKSLVNSICNSNSSNNSNNSNNDNSNSLSPDASNLSDKFNKFCKYIEIYDEMKKRGMDENTFIRCKKHYVNVCDQYINNKIILDEFFYKIQKLLDLDEILNQYNLNSDQKLFNYENKFLNDQITIDELKTSFLQKPKFYISYESFKMFANPQGSKKIPVDFKNNIITQLHTFYDKLEKKELIINDVDPSYQFFVIDKCNVLSLQYTITNNSFKITKPLNNVDYYIDHNKLDKIKLKRYTCCKCGDTLEKCDAVVSVYINGIHCEDCMENFYEGMKYEYL